MLMQQMLEKNLIDEKPKDINLLAWISLMNNYKNCAEEIIYSEITYC